jgi:c(7)-type cytochrome triheme protein
MLCHNEPKGTHPDEPRIRELAAAGREIPWVRVNRLPGHVYFSHEAHVTYAAMDCSECHGPMKQESAPITTSQIGALTMGRCVACHRSRGVRDDCSVCHK